MCVLSINDLNWYRWWSACSHVYTCTGAESHESVNVVRHATVSVGRSVDNGLSLIHI